MKNLVQSLVLSIVLAASVFVPTRVSAQGTAFTYQGQLQTNGSPASGAYNLTFALFNTNTAGAAVAGPVTNNAVSVTNGLFTTTIDFAAGAFTGATNWLQIGVATNGGTNFTPLNPRQQLTPVPYAIFASTASNLSGTVPLAQLSGITSNQLNATTWQLATNLNGGYAALASNVVSGISLTNAFITNSVFAGNGGGLTNLNGTQLSSGVVPYGVLPGFQSSSNYSTVGGGDGNTAGASYATVGGGYKNTASGAGAFIGGGGTDGAFFLPNTASGPASVVGGGLNNSATVYSATVPGGVNNKAGGDYSFAAGDSAQALYQGDFVWADSQGSDFTSTANDQFLIRAQGGVGINLNSNPDGPQTASLYVQGTNTLGWQNSVVWFQNTVSSISNAPALRVVNTSANATNHDGALSVSCDGQGLIAEFGNASAFVVTITNNGTIYATAFNNTSDRNAKENFTPVNAQEVLARVAALPLSHWNFKVDSATRHIGPMAQDFYQAFNVGTDDKHIATVDEDGVALAAIQGLNQKLDEKDAEITDLKARLAKLEQVVSALSPTSR